MRILGVSAFGDDGAAVRARRRRLDREPVELA